MLDELKSVFGKIKPQFDDDIVDRLNYIYTVFILSVFALVVGAKQYVGKPIQCWGPYEFDKSPGWQGYAESYCFVENTYFLQPTEEYPEDPSIRRDKEINYYQWVPIILAMQALMFYIPRLIWNMLNFGAGLHIPGIIESISNVTKDDKRQNRRALKNDKEHEKAKASSVAHIVMALEIKKSKGNSYDNSIDDQNLSISNDDQNLSRCNMVSSLKNATMNHPTYSSMKPPTKSVIKGYWITALYIFTKFLTVMNVVCQFLIMNYFFASAYTFWGLEILKDLINKREWVETGHFPRVTFCDFDIASLAQSRRYSVQCVLVINMFNEKIFLFLWWWFFVLGIVNVLNYFYWVVISVSSCSRMSFVKGYLEAKKINLEVITPDGTKKSPFHSLSTFVNFLRPDGILMLRLIAENLGNVTCSDAVAALWKVFWCETEPPKPDVKPVPNNMDPPKRRKAPDPVAACMDYPNSKKRPVCDSDGFQETPAR